jgi:ABC-2 type transport system permease protein
MSYSAGKTLPYRLELYRQLKRKRTAFAYAFVLSLPILVAIAVKFGPSGNSGGPTQLGSGTTDLIGLATIGAANFTVTMLYFATPFLLETPLQVRLHGPHFAICWHHLCRAHDY